MTTFLVPSGAEERALRRAVPHASIVGIRAGAAAAQLPAAIPAGELIVMGLCGALRTVRSGDVVVYRDVVDDAGRYAFDGERVDGLCARLPTAIAVRACTADHVVTRASERSALATAYDVDAVDMEGTHLVRALAAIGRAALVVRVASDDPSFDLPPIEDAFAPSGAIRPLHLARAFAAKPIAAARFIRDVNHALTILGETARALA